MRFSERKGFTKVSRVMQVDEINNDLRIALWNLFFLYESTLTNSYFDGDSDIAYEYWTSFRKRAADNIPRDLTREIRDIFTAGVWYEVYDFLEWILRYINDSDLNLTINVALERELASYRLIGGQISGVTDTQEIEMLESSLSDENFPHVQAHLHRALELLNDRKTPDYRNSIKESISAVESIAKEIAQKPKAELGDALKEIENQGKLHGAMKKAFLSLYGYTSDANGIRHALMEESNLTADDAKFFLLACTTFINYLKAKM